MECNKDEALRAKEIAEKKFDAKDYAAAKKFALKAQNLYPGLEGLPQMLATFDVYMCSLNKTNGEADWYGILGIGPSADDETVRKQFRKLALMLHPDKNKSIGAEGAFQLISQAWSLLSDKSKRALYDQRRGARVFHQKVTPPNQDRKAPPKANGFYEFAKSSVSSGRVKKNTSKASKSSCSGGAQTAKPDTFWTVCRKCKMQYEYLRDYLNQHLLCPNCQQPFLAIETPSPLSNGFKTSSSLNSSQQQRNSNAKSASQTKTSNSISGGFGNGISAASYRWTPFSQGGVSNVAHAASVVQQVYEQVKKEREEASAAKRQDKDMKRKHHPPEKIPGAFSSEFLDFANKRRMMEDLGLNFMNQSSQGAGGVDTASASLRHGYFDTIQVNTINKPFGERKLSQIEIRSILMEKVRTDFLKKIGEYKSKKMPNDATPREKAAEEAHNEDKRMKNPDMFNRKESKTSIDISNGILTDNGSPPDAAAATQPGKKTSESLSISVPDPDFYDFDKDRTERSFEENQVWAAYDNDDGMPRYYAIIHAVLSQIPFKVRISWLNPNRNTELGSLNWVGSGFSKTCGDFRVGRYEVNDSLNSFSHIVKWTKGVRGAIRIFPRKGDVWALYRNWSPDWNELTPDDIIHKYDMVEVIEDYDEELGVAIMPLVKVAGFKTVFRQNMDHSQIQRIPKEKMFQFSHQVPRHLLTAEEAFNTLKGCMELDPAATPLDLLHVAADVKEDVEEKATCETNLADIEREDTNKDLKQNVGAHQVAGNSRKRRKVDEILEID